MGTATERGASMDTFQGWQRADGRNLLEDMKQRGYRLLEDGF